MIRRSTETGCGNLIVDIFYDDENENSVIDPALFTLSQDSDSGGQFIVN